MHTGSEMRIDNIIKLTTTQPIRSVEYSVKVTG